MTTQTIYNGDCLNIMRTFPDKNFDLVLTSPPYNLGNTHHTGAIRHKAYDDNLPEDEYQDWQVLVLVEAGRLLSDNGSILYNHKNRIRDGQQITPYQWLLKTGLVIKQEIVWFNRSQNFDKVRFYPMTERIYWLSKKTDTQFVNTINQHDLLQEPAEGTGKEHTRAFPVSLASKLIACFPEAKTVLDPFMGSGTTLVAAKLLNRNATGIEISPEYCKIAEDRLRQEVMIF